MDRPAVNFTHSPDQFENQKDLGILFRPYDALINSDLHCTLINWLDYNTCMKDGGFEDGLACALRNVMSHGNSHLRMYDSEALANLQCLDRYRAGDSEVLE